MTSYTCNSLVRVQQCAGPNPKQLSMETNVSDKIVSIGGEPKPDLLQREQIAAQALAVIRAHWSRPSIEEIEEILKCMEGQAHAT